MNQSHNSKTFIYSCSRLFERASYYGLRSLVVIYMIGETLKMPSEKALSIYGWFTASYVFSQIIGALFGDLLLGNKRAVIIGGIIQAIGAFTFCIPSSTGLYTGLFLVVFGSGLYSPNIISMFGKSYLDRTKLLDSGFTIFYLAINIGAFIGSLMVTYFGEQSWNTGFIIAGIFMLISISFLIFSKNQEIPKQKIKVPSRTRILKILITPILVGLFWAAYEVSSMSLFDLQMKFGESSALNISKSIWDALSSTIVIPISIAFAIMWTFFYSNQFVKLTIGFIVGAFSFAILFFIPEIPTNSHLPIYFASILLLGVSEVHIAPVVNSIFTKYVNPKYLAVALSLAFVPSRLFNFLIGFFSENLYDKPRVGLAIGIVILTTVGIGLIIFSFSNKFFIKKTP